MLLTAFTIMLAHRWICVVCYTLACVGYLGLSACAHQLVDPFGIDETEIDLVSDVDSVNRLSKLVCTVVLLPA